MARGLYDLCLCDDGAGDTDDNIPADLYYACLNGTFDNDADGIYGEPTDGENGGEVDLLAEVYIGRAPVDSVVEVNNFVRKTLAYEDSTDTHLGNNYMVGEYLGFGGPVQYAAASMEEIRLGTSEHGFTTQGFISNPDRAMDANTLYDSDINSWSANELTDIMNNGVHIINHLGHSSATYNMKLQNKDVDALYNGKYFIVYSQGCYPAAFDNRDFDGNYLTSDCIAEHFVTSSAGAVAFIGNSRYGWGEALTTAGSGQYYNGTVAKCHFLSS
ncbi:MAG: C25 family cysteine peptidase [Candidatus Omnitrophota bacterium]